MAKPDFSEAFKRDAVAQITERGYPVAELASLASSGSASARTRFMPGSANWRGWCLAMLAPLHQNPSMPWASGATDKSLRPNLIGLFRATPHFIGCEAARHG